MATLKNRTHGDVEPLDIDIQLSVVLCAQITSIASATLVSKTLEEQQQSDRFGKRMTDCVTKRRADSSREDKREDRRRQRKTEREKRGERESDRQHFSLEETPRIEKLLSSNTGHIREHDDTHTMLSPHFFPSSVCNAKHLNHSPADLFTLPGVFLSRVQFQPQGCMLLLCLTSMSHQ